MTETRSLTVLMPVVPGQRWSCHSCGECCRTLVGHLTERECAQLDEQGWAEELGVAPYVQIGRRAMLSKRPDGACVFLDESNRCRIHSRFGESAKPLACRVFPFSLRAAGEHWQASLRFDCPSVIGSQGAPLSHHRAALEGMARELEGRAGGEEGPVRLSRGVVASAEELEVVTSRVERWMKRREFSLTRRLVGAARLITTLRKARYDKVRGRRFGELVDLLVGALPAQSAVPVAPATARQRAMVRQLAFAHAEHVTLDELSAGMGHRLRRRWRQLRMARAFRRGTGEVPAMPHLQARSRFAKVEAVQAARSDGEAVDDLIVRYVRARLAGRTVFGDGYYGWGLFEGLTALWLSLAAVGFLGRCEAASRGQSELTLALVGRALGVVDRAATRLPALGATAERVRGAYLTRDDGVARVVRALRLVENVT